MHVVLVTDEWMRTECFVLLLVTVDRLTPKCHKYQDVQWQIVIRNFTGLVTCVQASRAVNLQFVWSVYPTDSFTRRRGFLPQKPAANGIRFFNGSVSSVIVVAASRHWLLPIWTGLIHSSPYDLFTSNSDSLLPRLQFAISQVTTSLAPLLRCPYCIGVWQKLHINVMVLTPVSFTARRIVNTGATFQRVTIMAPLVCLLLCRRSIIGSCSSNISF